MIEGFQVAKVFHLTDCGAPSKGAANSLEFDDTGEFCLVGSDASQTIYLFDAIGGTERKRIFSKKYGVGPVRFSHHPNNVICAGKTDGIRYLSLHDNTFLTLFTGHNGPVCSLQMSPVNDTFISGAINDTVRLWDLRHAQCTAVLGQITGRPLIAYDPNGKIFAVALESHLIRLFDLKGIEKGPFVVFDVLEKIKGNWSSIQFSADGKKLVVGTDYGKCLVLDSFDGTILQVIEDFSNCCEPSIAPDSQCILAGKGNDVCAWNLNGGQLRHTLSGHTGPVSFVKFNPRHAMLASTCANNLAFWLPHEN